MLYARQLGATAKRRLRIELRHLRAFAAAADTLHFTQAASSLHLAQQALSAQIRQLEDELGVELFRRTTRKVELTEAGIVFRRRVAALLDDLDDAVEEARRLFLEEEEVLTVGYTPTVPADVLEAIVARVKSVSPDVRLMMCEGLTPAAVSGVAEGRFDVAIARCPDVPPEFGSIEIRPEPLGVVLGADDSLAALDVVQVPALADRVLTIWSRRLSPDFFDAVMAAFPAHRRQSRRYEMVHFTHETCFGDEVARREIAAGRAFYPTFAGHYDPVPHGFVWRPVDPPVMIGSRLFYRDANRSAALRLFVEAATAVAAEEAARTGSLRVLDEAAA